MEINKYKYTDMNGLEKILDLEEIDSFVREGKKIALIKEYRFITGKGLKDSKDAVEGAMCAPQNAIDGVLRLFKSAIGVHFEPYTKEEFLNLIEKAIDNMEMFYYDDMLEATLTTLTNVRNRGGLPRLAKERDEFLEKL